MPEERPSTQTPSRRGRPRRRPWLRIALFNLVFIAIPIGAYFLIYRDARIEQTPISKFRALDSAARGFDSASRIACDTRW